MKKLIIMAAILVTIAGSALAYNQFSKSDCCCGSDCNCTNCSCSQGACACESQCCEAACCSDK